MGADRTFSPEPLHLQWEEASRKPWDGMSHCHWWVHSFFLSSDVSLLKWIVLAMGLLPKLHFRAKAALTFLLCPSKTCCTEPCPPDPYSSLLFSWTFLETGRSTFSLGQQRRWAKAQYALDPKSAEAQCDSTHCPCLDRGHGCSQHHSRVAHVVTALQGSTEQRRQLVWQIL